ncbi:MAG: phosphopantetheine-binding protein [Candidatus Omnitrophica bacterium]|nr:phosphopantetheine-binding protein [Candidatus Omnitrophota bacterium]MDD5573565.1 phosphopantetheine-binding protein [Candidatus Omnitrophota bacterium]
MEDQIRDFIETSFGKPPAGFGNDTPLFETGVLDSMRFILLLAFLEKRFGVSVDMSEITITNFDTLSKIAGVVRKKQRKAA